VWTLFDGDENAPRDFLYCILSLRPFAAIVRSARQPRDPLEASGGAWRIETRPFAPRLAAGQQLRFRVRAVAALWRPQGHARRSRREDVIMSAWKRMPEEERSDHDRLEAVASEAALAWLTAQGCRRGFQPSATDVAVLAYDRERSPAKDPRRLMTWGAITYERPLTVTDEKAFLAALSGGIGGARAFGNGLIQIASAHAFR
jgi:CRISPR system Cascade subunit CasE